MTSDHITDAMVEAGASAAYGEFVSRQTHPDNWPSWGEMVAQGHQGLWRVNEFREIARAALLAAERAAWQSIETAPRDGRWVQLFVRCAGFNVVGCGYWVHDLGGNWITRGYSDPPGNLGLARPTHWRPLPPPPEPSHD